jgi:hypothetical protein
MAAQKHRRKKYLILLNFQLRYILFILLFLYVGAAVAGYTVYYTTWVTLGEKLANVYPRGRLIYIFHAANMSLLLRILLITPLFVLVGVLLSHRIAGPVYAIGRYIDNVMHGDYSRDLILRKKDELKTLAGKMTRLCHKLRDDKEKRETVVGDVIKTLQTQKVQPKIIEDIKEKLRSI